MKSVAEAPAAQTIAISTSPNAIRVPYVGALFYDNYPVRTSA